MTIKELKGELSEHPDDMEVKIVDNYGAHVDITKVGVEGEFLEFNNSEQDRFEPQYVLIS